MAEFSLTVIGSGSALPMHGRHPSAQVLRYGATACLIDCGEGTQERLPVAGVKPFSIRYILISHLHGDHVFGLPGLLSTFTHLKRTEPLTVYGPTGLTGLLDSIIHYTALKISYPLDIQEFTAHGLKHLFREGGFEVLAFPLQHRVLCHGYLVRETGSGIRLRKEIVEPLKLTPEQLQALKRGEDITYHHTTLSNAALTYGPEKPVSYAYCSDTKYDERILPWINQVGVLYHESTFGEELAHMAEETGHSTAAEAGRIAQKAGAGCLMTGHYSSRYKDAGPLIEEARAHFDHVVMAEEGKKYDLRSLAKGLMA